MDWLQRVDDQLSPFYHQPKPKLRYAAGILGVAGLALVLWAFGGGTAILW